MSTFIVDSAHFIANPLKNIILSFKGTCSICNFDYSPRKLDENDDLQSIQVPLESLMGLLSCYALNNAVPSSQGTDMYHRLSIIQKRLSLLTIQLTSFIPLINAIISNAIDVEIWNEVTQLVNTHEPIQSAEANMTTGQHGDAYHRRCSAPLEGPDQIMGTLKEALRTELAGTIFENVRGFYKKYFEGPKWANHCEEIAKHYKNRPDKEAFKFPKNPTEKNVWEWMKSIQNEFIEPYRPDESCKNKEDFSLRADSFQTTGPNQIKSGLAIRQIDIFIKSREKASKAHDWRDVLVLGELTELSTGQWVDKFLQLSVYMREVFSAQPLRQFAHGFLMFGTQLQPWVYDRSGPYSAEKIEIRESPEKLVYVLAAYMLMSDEEHGLDSILQREKGRLSVTIYDADTKKARKIYLRSKPLVKQMAIVTRGTTVYLFHDLKFVVKFSWRAAGRLSEVELLMKARNVRGVASLIRSQDVIKFSELGSCLTLTQKMNKDIHPIEVKMTTAVSSLQLGSSSRGESIEWSRGVKRDSEAVASDDVKTLRRSKRSCVLSISRQALHNATSARVCKNGKSTGSRKTPVSKTAPNLAITNANSTTQDLTQAATQDVTPETPAAPINFPPEGSISLAEGSNSSLGKRSRNVFDNDVEAQTLSEPDIK
ncbi:serine/threonine protein kinase domain protein [Blumeria hordei DH14]|uniref:Serine/threonine protein kinase domain protein n=1 Tax=Blumeria graminis f. sp. hordei (strain DH14) TaxID=546991 RepID=N1JQL5_BLUG1|nr:serine/threonine protein kinase domain protein [Blumeria hordei DH14]